MRTGAVITKISLVFILPLLIQSISAPAMAKPKKDGEWRVSPRKAKIKNPITADQASVEQGKVLFQRECENCHGKSGKGDGPEAGDLDKKVKDFSSPGMWEQSDGAIYYKIKMGRRPMPSFKKMLSKEEIWHVTNYIRKTFDSAAK
ncbi:MAG: mono/diheme cytochrome c family protein [Phenylobacterium sp.]|jgi:mono/diheme cytochrome c family protein